MSVHVYFYYDMFLCIFFRFDPYKNMRKVTPVNQFSDITSRLNNGRREFQCLILNSGN